MFITLMNTFCRFYARFIDINIAKNFLYGDGTDFNKTKKCLCQYRKQIKIN